MNRDPTVVGRARVSAETFAEIVNSFIEPISYKTMVSLFEACLIVVILPIGCLWIGLSV
jgi:Di-sulfide bridge nucleocytoplasmic transport domain